MPDFRNIQHNSYTFTTFGQNSSGNFLVRQNFKPGGFGNIFQYKNFSMQTPYMQANNNFMPQENYEQGGFSNNRFNMLMAGILRLNPFVQQPQTYDFNVNNPFMLSFNNMQNPVLNRPANQNTLPPEQAAKTAVNTILENFDSLGLPQEAKNYLSNIEFKNENFGTARADTENGKIIVNTNSAGTNPTDMVKVLIHESLHCVNKSPFSSVEEEYNCEQQAIQATAKLIEAGKLEDCQIYNSSMRELGAKGNEALLESSLKNWLDSGGYDNRILDSEGNVNIEQYQIRSGDTIKINGKECGTIGEYFIEGIQSSSICQFFSINSENRADCKGSVIFDNTTQTPDERRNFLRSTNNPQKIEIIRDGKVVCTGTIYNSNL